MPPGPLEIRPCPAGRLAEALALLYRHAPEGMRGQLVRNAQADAARAQEAVAARVAAEIELQKRQGREAAKLVASGNCAGAESYALSEGNLNLAKTVREYCAAAGK